MTVCLALSLCILYTVTGPAVALTRFALCRLTPSLTLLLALPLTLPLALPLGLSRLLCHLVCHACSATGSVARCEPRSTTWSAHSVSSQGGLVDGENCGERDQPDAEPTKEHSLPCVRARREPSECDLRGDSRRAAPRLPKDRVSHTALHSSCFRCHCVAHIVSLRRLHLYCAAMIEYCHFTLQVIVSLCASFSRIVSQIRNTPAVSPSVQLSVLAIRLAR